MTAYLYELADAIAIRPQPLRPLTNSRTSLKNQGLLQLRINQSLRLQLWSGQGIKSTHYQCPSKSQQRNYKQSWTSVPFGRIRAFKTMIQTLAGRLVYIYNRVRAGKKFTTRILMTLRGMGQREWTTIGSEFLEYATVANGVFLLPVNSLEVNIFCDLFLIGGGGPHDQAMYYTWIYADAHIVRRI